MKTVNHWQDRANAVVGAALILSPWAIRYDSDMTATANALIVGVALIAAAFGAIATHKAWEEWVEAILGLWMLLSPWMLGFSHHTGAMLCAVAAGLIVVVFSLWTLATDRDFSLPKSMMP